MRLGLERLSAVRDTVGTQVHIMVDCHGRLSVDTAKALVPALKDLAVYWLEEPVMSHPQMNAVIGLADGIPETTYEHGVRLRPLEDCGIPLAGGEFDYGIDRFESILESGSLSFVMPDVKHCGGVWAATVIGWLGSERGVRLSPHNPSGPVATIASMHVCAAASNFEILEYQWGEVTDPERLLSPYAPQLGGVLGCPSRPGFGSSLDYDALHEREATLD